MDECLVKLNGWKALKERYLGCMMVQTVAGWKCNCFWVFAGSHITVKKAIWYIHMLGFERLWAGNFVKHGSKSVEGRLQLFEKLIWKPEHWLTELSCRLTRRIEVGREGFSWAPFQQTPQFLFRRTWRPHVANTVRPWVHFSPTWGQRGLLADQTFQTNSSGNPTKGTRCEIERGHKRDLREMLRWIWAYGCAHVQGSKMLCLVFAVFCDDGL